jgi:myo-inositol-1(or 4)-monophosphatase
MSPDRPPPAAGQPFRAVAVEAARLAGAIQLRHFERDVRVSSKGRADLVTEVDLEIEAAFRELIASRFPDHGVLGEELAETAARGAGPSHRWLFDPLDGTANYVHRVPFFCVSIALEIDGTVALAAVYDALRDELFTAERGGGARLNDTPVGVSDARSLDEAMLGTGFPHGASVRAPDMERLLGECAIRARGVRRLGSAALDLSYVACGRLDAFWDRNLKPWDTAAGALIVHEAGGVVTGLDGSPFSCYTGHVLASNSRLHASMLDLARGPR